MKTYQNEYVFGLHSSSTNFELQDLASFHQMMVKIKTHFLDKNTSKNVQKSVSNILFELFHYNIHHNGFLYKIILQSDIDNYQIYFETTLKEVITEQLIKDIDEVNLGNISKQDYLTKRFLFNVGNVFRNSKMPIGYQIMQNIDSTKVLLFINIKNTNS